MSKHNTATIALLRFAKPKNPGLDIKTEPEDDYPSYPTLMDLDPEYAAQVKRWTKLQGYAAYLATFREPDSVENMSYCSTCDGSVLESEAPAQAFEFGKIDNKK